MGSLVRVAITTQHRLGAYEISVSFSRCWRLEVQDQGSGRLSILWELSGWFAWGGGSTLWSLFLSGH